MAVLSNDIVATGSNDYTVKIYEFSSQKLLTTLYGHKNWVTALAKISTGVDCDVA